MDKAMSGSLASLSEQQEYPRMMTADQAKVTPVKAGNGQSGAQGWSEGMNTMPKRSVNQDGPRHAQDGGPGKSGAGTPSNWGTADGFAPSKNTGDEGTSVKVADIGVDFKTGLAMYCNPLPK